MKKLLLLSVAIFLSGNFINAQNLVPNPGFETYSSCPTTDGQIIKASGWFDPTGTGPDYFNSCASSGSGYSVPANDLGTMNPKTGNAYAGFFTYFSLSVITNLREYIQIQLSAPLAADSVYAVSFYVARAAASTFAASTIGAYFSDSPVNPPSNTTGSITPQVVNSSSNIISDTTTWTLISGSFTALGGEQFLTIGNFNTSDNSNPVYVGGSGSAGTGYYLIDDISVVNDETTGMQANNGTAMKASVYHNRATDQLDVSASGFLKNEDHLMLALYDLTGRLILSSPVTESKHAISTERISQGIYICNLISGAGILVSKKISMMK